MTVVVLQAQERRHQGYIGLQIKKQNKNYALNSHRIITLCRDKLALTVVSRLLRQELKALYRQVFIIHHTCHTDLLK